jgi:hypothetical protein
MVQYNIKKGFDSGRINFAIHLKNWLLDGKKLIFKEGMVERKFPSLFQTWKKKLGKNS